MKENASETPPTKKDKSKIGLLSILVGLYLGFVWVGVPVYNRFLKPRDPTRPVFRNGLTPDSPYSIEMFLEKNGKPVEVAKDTSFSYNWKNSHTKMFNITLPEDFKSNYSRQKLIFTLKYHNQCTKKQEVIGCSIPLYENLEERLHGDKSYVDGVIPKDAVGNKTDHFLSKIFFGIVYDTNERVFGENQLIDYIYSSTNSGQTLSKTQPCYHPALDCSNYWTLRRDKIPVSKMNETSLSVGFYTVWDYQFEWVKHFEMAQKNTALLVDVGSAFDDLKEMLSDNSYWYLGLLFTVNILHTLFFTLGMTSSYSFWSKLDSSTGLSPGKYYSDVIFQFIILLYMIDNDTSLLLIVLFGFEMLMTVYIAIKITGLSLRFVSKFPYVRFSSKQRDEETATHEKTAVKFMTKVILPFLFIYIAYSYTQIGNMRMYSFILKTLVTSIYVVGFINMTPQIYINYKLQSVESLPWKTMTYQFLNTIIDDLFAFAIKMTTLQRVSVFRDDLIFVIFLVQMWIYRKNKREEKKKQE